MLKAFCSSETCAGMRNMVIIRDVNRDQMFCHHCNCALFWIDCEKERSTKKYLRTRGPIKTNVEFKYGAIWE